jgi:phospholipid-transporting ATPase
MNVTFVCFSFVSAFSSQPIYTSGLIATMNLFWSSYVIVAYAVIEQDVSPDTVMRSPALYRETMTFTRCNFLLYQGWYIVEGTWHGLVIYFLCMYTMANPNRSGIGADWVEIGCTMYMALIITINAKLAMKTRHWTWITHLLTYLSVLTLFIFYYLYGIAFPIYHLEGTGNMADIAVGQRDLSGGP